MPPLDLGPLAAGTTGFSGSAAPQGVTLLPTRIHWSQALVPVSQAAAIAGILSLLPRISALCCLWLPLGGLLAVWFYKRTTPTPRVSAGMGFRLGAVTGVIAYGLYIVISAAELLIARFALHQNVGAELRATFLKALEQGVAKNPTPEAQQMLKSFSSPEGMAIAITLGLVLMFLGFIIFSSLGGGAGSVMFGEKDSPIGEPPPPQ